MPVRQVRCYELQGGGCAATHLHLIMSGHREGKCELLDPLPQLPDLLLDFLVSLEDLLELLEKLRFLLPLHELR